MKQFNNKYELIAYLIRMHWWKVLLLILVSGLVATGFHCDYKDLKIHKDPIYRSP